MSKRVESFQNVLKRVEAFALRHVDDANSPDVVEPNWSTKQDLGEHDVSIEDSARLATDSEDEPRRKIIVVSILIDRFLRVNKKNEWGRARVYFDFL